MVAYTEVLTHNASLPAVYADPTAVFVGATQGIGLATARALSKHTSKPTIFLLGRSDARLDNVAADLRAVNASVTVHTIQTGDLAILANVKAAVEKLKNHPSTPPHIDLLVLSSGYLTFAGRTPTAEALDHLTSIRYYSRMLFATSLLPLLRLSPTGNGRVISVLAGGKEGQLWPDDFLLETHYSIPIAGGAAASMNTLFMESLAKKPENVKLSFVHLFPGIVPDTQNLQQVEHWGWLARTLLGWVVLPVMKLFGRTSVEAGERVLFAATRPELASSGDGLEVGSDGRKGSGVYLVQGDGSVVPATKVCQEMRRDGVPGKLWEHTEQVFASVK